MHLYKKKVKNTTKNSGILHKVIAKPITDNISWKMKIQHIFHMIQYIYSHMVGKIMGKTEGDLNNAI